MPFFWWLIRFFPPAPRRIIFPPIHLLSHRQHAADSPDAPDTRRRSPWWLVVLRLSVVVCLILAAARPVFAPDGTANVFSRPGAVVVVFEDTWTAQATRPVMLEAAQHIIAAAGQEGRAVLLLSTAPSPTTTTPSESVPAFIPAAQAAERLQAIATHGAYPWSGVRRSATEAIKAVNRPVGDIFWFVDGLHHDREGVALGDALAPLQRIAPVRVYDPLRIADTSAAMESPPAILLITQPRQSTRPSLHIPVVRVMSGAKATWPALSVPLSAHDAAGTVLVRGNALFAPGATRTEAVLDVAAHHREQVRYIRIDGATGAGATYFLNDAWHMPLVGLVREKNTPPRPLLDAHYYITRALDTHARALRGTVTELLTRAPPPSALIIDDPTALSATDIPRITHWMEAGGVLITFADQALLQDTALHPLLPAAISNSLRVMGGQLSWQPPQGIAPFPADSPYGGLSIAADIKITRQILPDAFAPTAPPATSSPPNRVQIWATTTDNTALVCARRVGQGLTVFFHSGATPVWGNLPIRGLFVSLLHRTVRMKGGVRTALNNTPKDTFKMPYLVLSRLSNGNGQVVGSTQPMHPLTGWQETRHLPSHIPPNPISPGLYGHQGSLRVAFNIHDLFAQAPPLALDELPQGIEITHATPRVYPLSGALLLAALIALAAEFALLNGAVFRTRSFRARRTRWAGVLFVFIAVTIGCGAMAADAEEKIGNSVPPQDLIEAIQGATTLRLAWVKGDDPTANARSAAALSGLTRTLAARTSVEMAAPVAFDPEHDDPTFYPLLYWYVDTTNPTLLSPAAYERFRHWLRHGGLILYDSPQGRGMNRGEILAQLLHAASGMAGGVDSGAEVSPLRALVPVPTDHALRRTFYLLPRFTGRWHDQDNPVYLLPIGTQTYDGLSPIIAGSLDWAGAWAITPDGRYLLPMVSGNDQHREQALRFGVNVVMYALSGNYKTDQLHQRALLERLE